jgi:HPt (histidine-containing phosphotransfer) domain-containing protein
MTSSASSQADADSTVSAEETIPMGKASIEHVTDSSPRGQAARTALQLASVGNMLAVGGLALYANASASRLSVALGAGAVLLTAMTLSLAFSIFRVRRPQSAAEARTRQPLPLIHVINTQSAGEAGAGASNADDADDDDAAREKRSPSEAPPTRRSRPKLRTVRPGELPDSKPVRDARAARALRKGRPSKEKEDRVAFERRAREELAADAEVHGEQAADLLAQLPDVVNAMRAELAGGDPTNIELLAQDLRDASKAVGLTLLAHAAEAVEGLVRNGGDPRRVAVAIVGLTHVGDVLRRKVGLKAMPKPEGVTVTPPSSPSRSGLRVAAKGRRQAE